MKLANYPPLRKEKRLKKASSIVFKFYLARHALSELSLLFAFARIPCNLLQG
jgi:hypothetical protein